MCGIVGYLGQQQAYPILIQGLKRLEYRGYDSAGIALVHDNGELEVFKSKGKVTNLEHVAQGKDLSGTTLIHNGIIENYVVLRETLREHGYTFQSDTDTEVLVQLIEFIKQTNHCDLCTAVQLALHEVVGAYAIAIVEKDNPDLIVAARKSSPLVIGIKGEERFLASDAAPIIEHTKEVVYLNDEEIAVIRRGEPLQIVTLDNVEKPLHVKMLEMNISQLEKGGFPHFMLKEIYEQPRTIIDCIRGRVNPEGTDVILSGVRDNQEKFLNANRIIIVACGTSWHAGLIGKHLIEELCRIPVEVEYASEFRYRNPIIRSNDIVIAISQSGETADTLAAVELARNRGAFIYGICNVIGSSIARATDSGSYIHVGPEIGVASTKAFTGQVTVLIMLALAVAKLKKSIAPELYTTMLHDLQQIPKLMKKVLKLNDQIADMSKIFTYAHNFIYLGRGYNYPVALEGALKLKEISYIHAEGYPAAEMKHGPIALIDSEMPVVAIATSDSVYEKTISNIQEIKARRGKVIAIVTEGDDQVFKMVDYVIEIPKVDERLIPLVVSLPLQMLAYHIAVYKNRDVDRPRNLAKSVTVE